VDGKRNPKTRRTRGGYRKSGIFHSIKGKTDKRIWSKRSGSESLHEWKEQLVRWSIQGKREKPCRENVFQELLGILRGGGGNRPPWHRKNPEVSKILLEYQKHLSPATVITGGGGS